jgi:lysophospholipase L1-like esterase
MSSIRRLRRVVAVTAIAGTMSSAVVLAAQAITARTRRYAKPDMGLAVRSSTGPGSAPPLRLVLLGDSTALGVGVDRVQDTVGGQLASMLAQGPDRRRVELSSVAVSGSRSADLGIQVARALVGHRPEVAGILLGGNDVLRFGRAVDAAEHLAAAARRLRSNGVAVIVGTCPDLAAARAFDPPLREIIGWRGRRLAGRQAIAARAAGAIVVDLGEQTGAVFRADAGTFCHDGFHPSADGYRIWAHALLPAVQKAVSSSI